MPKPSIPALLISFVQDEIFPQQTPHPRSSTVDMYRYVEQASSAVRLTTGHWYIKPATVFFGSKGFVLPHCKKGMWLDEYKITGERLEIPRDKTEMPETVRK